MNYQTPKIKLGSDLLNGKVIAIRRGSVDILIESRVETLSFATVEKEVFCNG